MTEPSKRSFNVLLYACPVVEMGKPDFRVGAYQSYLFPIYDTLRKGALKHDARILVGSPALKVLESRVGPSALPVENIIEVDPSQLLEALGHPVDYVGSDFRREFKKPQIKRYTNYLRTILKDFKPDLVISWESPTWLLKEALEVPVLELMPGFGMRPPYPRTISLDTSGLYQYSSETPTEKAQPREIETLTQVSQMYQRYFKSLGKMTFQFEGGRQLSQFKKLILLPLQIEKYFGYRDSTPWKSQFELLCRVLDLTPKDIGVVVTQYVASHIADEVISDDNIGYLTSTYPNLLFSRDFNKVNNISQYWVPQVDAVVSVSSTLGIQALILGKPLVSPGYSHLSKLTPYNSLDDIGRAIETEFPDLSLQSAAQILNCSHILWENFLTKPAFLESLVSAIVQNPQQSIYEVLRDGYTSDNELVKAYEIQSNFRRATELVERHIDSKRADEALLVARSSKPFSEANVISFDIFDTLVERPVLRPDDIFILIQKYLREKTEYEDLADDFPTLRTHSEFSLKKRREEGSLQGEETTIEEIYEELLSALGITDPKLKRELIQLEQEIELAHLTPRSSGQFLYQKALESGKRVILISDFAHPKEFVEKVLEQTGYRDYQELYVSSEINLKKHTGSLFKHVLNELKINASQMVHIGDNPTGDIERSRIQGIRPIHLAKSDVALNRICKHRGLPLPKTLRSLYHRSIYNLAAQRFRDLDAMLSPQKAPTQIFESREMIGYLCLGPIALEFARWCISQARKDGCEQLVFLARDTWLPYIACNALLEDMQDKNITATYMHASRKALQPLVYRDPSDWKRIRIDDFHRHGTLQDFLEQRVGLNSSIVSQTLLDSCEISDISAPLSKIPRTKLARFLRDLFETEWNEISRISASQRAVFERYIKDIQLNTAKQIAVVDVGYTGTLHKQLSHILNKELIPYFYMTYSDKFGENTLKSSRVYRNGPLDPSILNAGVEAKFNLTFETLLNHAEGSTVGYLAKENGASPIIDDSLSSVHFESVREIHAGASLFIKDWLTRFPNIDLRPEPEANLTTNFLELLLEYGDEEELKLLSHLEFDNSFAGHRTRKVLDSHFRSRPQRQPTRGHPGKKSSPITEHSESQDGKLRTIQSALKKSPLPDRVYQLINAGGKVLHHTVSGKPVTELSVDALMSYTRSMEDED